LNSRCQKIYKEDEKESKEVHHQDEAIELCLNFIQDETIDPGNDYDLVNVMNQIRASAGVPESRKPKLKSVVKECKKAVYTMIEWGKKKRFIILKVSKNEERIIAKSVAPRPAVIPYHTQKRPSTAKRNRIIDEIAPAS
jgi:hypothetical protein